VTYLHTAARRGELFRLWWQDVDFGSGAITLSTRKRADGSLEYDALPMTDELYNLLSEHKQTAPSTEWVFINPVMEAPFVERKLWMGGLCKRAGVKAFGLHAIRHLTASILAREGISSVDIQAILRHKKLTTTERYLHRLNDLKPALRVLPKSKSRQAEPSPSAKRPSVLEVVK
jgi:integrase